MRTKRYWINRYMDFINKVLGREIEINTNIAKRLREESNIYLTRYLSDIKDNPHEVKETVFFLHVNHQLNVMDPIGICYPGIIFEYSSYAWKMVELLLQFEDKNSLYKKLRKEMVDMWWSVASQPDEDREIINKGCRDIVSMFYTISPTKHDKQRASYTEEKHWLKQFYLFVNKTLGHEIMKYQYEATLLQEEVDILLNEKEKNFTDYEENIHEYIYFLYVNHQLNVLDPVGNYYPGLTYYHKQFAWDIVKAYKNYDEEGFINKVYTIIHSMYDDLGCDTHTHQLEIRYRIKKIQEIFKSLNK